MKNNILIQFIDENFNQQNKKQENMKIYMMEIFFGQKEESF